MRSFWCACTLIFLFSTNLCAQTFIKADSLRNRIQRNAHFYLDPHGRIKGHYAIDVFGISIFASPEDKLKNSPECKIYWEELETFRQLAKQLPEEQLINIYKAKKNNRFPDTLSKYLVVPSKLHNSLTVLPKPLKGLKIALDPGHVAGNIETALYELKYLKLKKDSLAGINAPIELIEGNLTLATSFFLKQMLEEAGAEVMLTRDKADHSAFGVTFDDWMMNATKHTFEEAFKNGEISLEEKNRFIKYKAPKDIFQNYFRFADLYERARIINAYKPDLTVIIHYNVDEKNKPWTSPTSKNFNMVFVPGDVKPGFLRRVENRYGLLRMLATTDIEESIQLGDKIMRGFEVQLEVPTAKPQNATYLKDDCIITPASGVFVRNLALTRLIRGPVAYGESLYQDNLNECQLLSTLTLEIGGVKTSERVKQVARSYYEGILNYLVKVKS